MQGVLQRSGAKNQNGRVYPKDILAREVENYKNTPVNESQYENYVNYISAAQIEASKK